MKRKIAAVVVLIMAVALGAMLPKIVLTYQDNKLQKSTDKYSVEQKNFKTENKIINTLDYYSKGYIYEVKDSVTDYHLSEKQVKRNIQKFLTALNKYSLYQIDYSKRKVFKYGVSLYVSDYATVMSDTNYNVVTSDSNNDSKYIIYHCIIETKDGFSVDLQLDEETGQVISFNIYNKKMDFQLFKSVEMAKNFLQEYYGVNADFNKESSGDFQWYFNLYDAELSKKATLEIYTIKGNGIYFNQ